jgi:hypothetical protein
MKIATWNCNMAFRKKRRQLLDHDPDVLVIQECEDPAYKGSWDGFTDWEWIGENRNKGLGVFTRNGHRLDRIETEEPDSKYVLPVRIDEGLKLLGVWAMNDDEQPAKRYIGQVYTTLEQYDFVDDETVVAGDFNWNVIWDESPKSPLRGTFEDVVEQLSAAGLGSAYHRLSECEYGSEPDPTFYMHKKEGRPYHTDYLYVPVDAIESATLTVGGYEA